MVNDFFTPDLFLARPFTGVQPAHLGASRVTTGFANPAIVAPASKSRRVGLNETVASLRMYRRFPNLPYRRFPNLRNVRIIPAARLFVRSAGWARPP